MEINKYSYYAPLILRLGIGFVFIWFGLSGLLNPEIWIGMVPGWTNFLGSARNLVLIHGAIETILGFLLCAGVQIRWVSFLLFLSLLQTLTLLSFGPIMVRDIGLIVALIAIWLDNK